MIFLYYAKKVSLNIFIQIIEFTTINSDYPSEILKTFHDQKHTIKLQAIHLILKKNVTMKIKQWGSEIVEGSGSMIQWLHSKAYHRNFVKRNEKMLLFTLASCVVCWKKSSRRKNTFSCLDV